ncbi:hypothetical protein [Acinetobacter ursingii]|uniref:hypothetical protein n=1 Tax=Acinetobacter ursingii TaxID=108980 RepID=UPI003AF6233E
MYIYDLNFDSSVQTGGLPQRFIKLKSDKKIKKFLVQRRGYKAPDFGRMILDLRNLGWSHEKISYVLDASSSAVSSWATGSIPNYEHGDAFIELWREQTGVNRIPRLGEWQSYKYEIGQLELL